MLSCDGVIVWLCDCAIVSLFDLAMMISLSLSVFLLNGNQLANTSPTPWIWTNTSQIGHCAAKRSPLRQSLVASPPDVSANGTVLLFHAWYCLGILLRGVVHPDRCPPRGPGHGPSEESIAALWCSVASFEDAPRTDPAVGLQRILVWLSRCLSD